MSLEQQKHTDAELWLWVQSIQLHEGFSNFLKGHGRLISAAGLLTGHGFDAYLHRRLDFNVALNGTKLDVVVRAIDPPKDNIVIVDLSDREKPILVSPRRLYYHKPPSAEELELIEQIFQKSKRILHRRSRKARMLT